MALDRWKTVGFHVVSVICTNLFEIRQSSIKKAAQLPSRFLIEAKNFSSLVISLVLRGIETQKTNLENASIEHFYNDRGRLQK